MVHSARRAQGRVGIPLGAFFLLTLGSTMMILAAASIATRPGLAPMSLFTPGVVAFALVLARRGDPRTIIGSPPHPGSVVACLLGGPAAATLVLTVTDASRELVVEDPVTLLVALAAAVSGELGWRGYLQPLLGTRFPALVAGLMTGLAWAVWQLPPALAGAGPFPGLSPVDVLGWSLATAIAFSATLELAPRSTWYPIALQLGLTFYLTTSSLLPGVAGGRGPFRLLTALVASLGIVILVLLRRNADRGRHVRDAARRARRPL